MRILVVEDNRAHVKMMQRAFECRAPETQLEFAHSISSAQAVLVRDPPDLLITDLRLPDGSGLGFLPADDDQFEELPFPLIVMTARGDERVAVTAMRRGATDYIVKSDEALIEMPRTAERVMRDWNSERERRALREQLRHAQKLEAIGQLSSGVSHDFNNLLTVVLSSVELALTSLEDEQPDLNSIREDLDAIETAAKRGNVLTRQLLALSRRQVVRSEPISLSRVVEGIEDLLQRLLRKNVEIVYDLDPQVPLIEADPNELELVIINLAVNAADAMPNGGRLSIATRRSVASDGLGEDVVLYVSDTGEGIAPDLQGQIFDPFFTTKGLGKGTGLGLATVHRIVGEAGGRIDVASRPGEGATFTICFPSLRRGLQEPAWQQASGASETVLLCEHRRDLRDIISRTLNENGYAVLVAESEADALRMAEESQRSIEFVVSDLTKQSGDGSGNLAERLSEFQPDIRAFYVSGDGVVQEDRATVPGGGGD